ncbi:copia protein [Tanacetum coccineum]
MYPTHTKIINSTIGDDQIDSDIIFDSPNGNVNSGSIKKDTHVPDLCSIRAENQNILITISELKSRLANVEKVRKTRFSKESTLSKSLDTTYVVSKPKIDVGSTSKANDKVVQIVLWIVDSGCSKHMTGDRSLLKNFIEKFMGTVRFGNDNFAAITMLWCFIQGNITICHVYYVEGLGHNLFSVGQFCDGNLEVAFCSKTFTLSHLNFGTINDLTRLDLVDGLPKFKYGKDHLCSACERGKSKKASHPLKLVPSDHSKLELLHMDLCGPMRVASINGKNYEEIESSTTALEPSNVQNFHQVQPSTHIWTKDHPLDQVIGDPSKPVMTRQRLHTDSEVCMYALTVSTIEPKNIKEAMVDHSWIESMQYELNQFERLQVWELVPGPEGKNVIALKWLWKNKCDAENIMVRNKTHLVAKGYKQEEGIDFEESFAQFFLGLQVHQSPRGIFISQSQYAIELLKKHGLDECVSMSTPMETERLDADLQGTPTDQMTYNRMIGGLMYLTASRLDIAFCYFFKKIQVQKGFPIISIRTDHGREFDNEVQFGAFCDANGITHNFSAPRTPQSNGVVELYLTASRPDIMFSGCLCARFQETPKTSHLEAVKRIFRYIKGTFHLGLWYPKGTGLETIVFADSDYARDYVDRKSTSGVCTFVGCCLTSWMSKKQTTLAISTTEAEYVSAEKACQQALWMKEALVDYKVKLNDVPVLCDNKGAIYLSKNPVLHSRTKHIEIRHHFLHDNIQKGNISIEKVASEDNIADILTKPLKREPFNLLRIGLGLMEPNS